MIGTIAPHFVKLASSGKLLAFFSHAAPGASTSCGFYPPSSAHQKPRTNCCEAGQFYTSKDGGLNWAYQGSFDSVQRYELGGWGRACTSVDPAKDCGLQVAGAGEAHTAVELDDGTLMTVARQSSRFRPPDTVLGAEVIPATVNPYGKYGLRPDNMILGDANRERR